MVVQEITYLVQDKNQVITLESTESKETIEVNAYLLSKSLVAVEGLSGENIKLSVNDKAFEGFRAYFGK